MKKHSRTNKRKLLLFLVIVAIVLVIALDGHVGRFLQPSLQSNELWEVQQNGKIVPRAGILLQTVLTLGIHPNQIDGAEQLEGENWIFPAKGARPAWITKEMEERLLAGETVEATLPIPVPYSVFFEGKIKPGAWMASPNWCTLNYIFRNKITGEYAVGTAGHCVDGIGQRIWIDDLRLNPKGDIRITSPQQTPNLTRCVIYNPPFGAIEFNSNCVYEELTMGGQIPLPLTQNIVLTRIEIGEVILGDNFGGIYGAKGVGRDFALIRIYPELYDRIDPRINLIDGPCGYYQGYLAPRGLVGPVTEIPQKVIESMPLLHFGHGAVTGTGGTPRTGIGSAPNPDELAVVQIVSRDKFDAILWYGSLSMGDSGSPVRIWNGNRIEVGSNRILMAGNGAAAGVLTHESTTITALGVGDVQGWGTSMKKVLEMVGPDWELVSSPDCPVPI